MVYSGGWENAEKGLQVCNKILNDYQFTKINIFRLLAQIYQRIKEPELALFFAENRPFLKQIISTGNGKVAKSSHQWRIAIYRNVSKLKRQFIYEEYNLSILHYF
jgi:hypothetical protein